MTDSKSFDPLDFPDRINIGCGFDHRDGYLNVDFQDFHDPDLVADVRDLAMLPSDHYTEIVAQDVLEHLERAEVDPALVEWARLLKTGGQIFLRVPDIMGVARLIAREATVEHHRTMLHALFGTQAYNGDYHHASFTELTLRRSLHDAGFEISDLRPRDQWMIDCVATKSDTLDPGPLPLLSLEPEVLAPDQSEPSEDASPDDTPKSTTTDAIAERFESAATALSRRVPDDFKDKARGALRSGRDRFEKLRKR
ncbi:MAG: methyltransferase domain-containing protein [Actinobacteria bacterium]|nr:methyltransferase domain-containing protein [Actinomycetota bacterium]